MWWEVVRLLEFNVLIAVKDFELEHVRQFKKKYGYLGGGWRSGKYITNCSNAPSINSRIQDKTENKRNTTLVHTLSNYSIRKNWNLKNTENVFTLYSTLNPFQENYNNFTEAEP